MPRVAKPSPPRLPPPAPPAPANAPVHKLRHRGLEVAVWKNPTKNGPMYNATISRSYKENDVWRESQTFGYDDLMNVAKLLADAHSWISAQRTREAAERKSNTMDAAT